MCFQITAVWTMICKVCLLRLLLFMVPEIDIGQSFSHPEDGGTGQTLHNTV